jgi:hypothetical protein
MKGAINANHYRLTPRAANPPHRRRHQSDYHPPPSQRKRKPTIAKHSAANKAHHSKNYVFKAKEFLESSKMQSGKMQMDCMRPKQR